MSIEIVIVADRLGYEGFRAYLTASKVVLTLMGRGLVGEVQSAFSSGWQHDPEQTQYVNRYAKYGLMPQEAD